MTVTDFTYLLQNPQIVTSVQTDELETIITEFPYFQSARAVYLKGLKNRESFKYNQELKTTAAYTTDRSVLFDYITSEVFAQNDISRHIKQSTEHLKDVYVNEPEDISVERSITIDHALKKQVQDTKGVLDPSLFQPKIEVEKIADFTKKDSIIEVDTVNIEHLPEEQLQIGKPLDFEKNETHSFAEWLKITAFKPIERDTQQEQKEEQSTTKNTNSTKAKKFELIDKFLTSNSKIDPTKSASSSKNLAKKQMIQPEALMTETLARIYLEQKNFEKAIQSYRNIRKKVVSLQTKLKQ